MALHNIPMKVKEFSFSLPRPSRSITLKIVNHLSHVKFDGEGEVTVVEHVYRFFNKCRFYKIYTDNEICRLFTLTFEGRIES